MKKKEDAMNLRERLFLTVSSYWLTVLSYRGRL